jgi:hypothetical protein
VADVEEAVASILIADPVVSGMIGPRIYQHKLAQNSQLPALTYQLIDDPSENSHDGASGLAKARLQIDCWGSTKSDATALAVAVKGALVGVKRYSAGVLIGSILKISEMSMFDPDVRLRRRLIDFAVWHSE